MTNDKKYHFADFTFTEFRKHIVALKQKFQFVTYREIDNASYVLWRHDVDFSMDNALTMARIEAEEGVRSTYFILPHCEFYNFFELKSKKIIEEILFLGHEIGLHFDANYWNVTNTAELEQALEKEKQIINLAFGIDINVFSFHNPTAFELSCLQREYAGMVNTYSSFFKETTSYCSDSNGYWRFERLANFIEKSTPDQRVQILTHPELWQHEIMSPKQRLWHCIDQNAIERKLYVEMKLKEYGRAFIDWN